MLAVLFLAVGALVVDVQAADQCHPGWYLYGDMCYGFGDDLVSWGEAQIMCQTYGATLAEPRTSSVNDWLKVELKGMQLTNAWLGATDVFHEGTWEWVSDRSTIGPFTDWRPGQPDHDAHGDNHGEDCLEYVDHGAIHWNDRDCSDMSSFICQIRADSEAIVG